MEIYDVAWSNKIDIDNNLQPTLLNLFLYSGKQTTIIWIPYSVLGADKILNVACQFGDLLASLADLQILCFRSWSQGF